LHIDKDTKCCDIVIGMKVLVRQFLGKPHSWSVCGWGWGRALKQLGHEVHLFSTDGIKNIPSDLKENLIGYTEENQNQVHGRLPDKDYDAQFSYTCMKNFQNYLSFGTKNRFGTWCYEWAGKNVLPNGFAKNYKYCDKLCAPSKFAKRVFLESGIPEDAIIVIPHGIDVERYKKTTTISEITSIDKFKIGCVLGQNHIRKNIPGMLEAYGKAFTNKDDVCLILKASEKPIKQQFDVSLNACLNAFKSKFPKHAEIKVISNFIDDMSDFYRSIDASYTMTHCECFYLPSLESAVSGKLSIAPNWGGQLDILNKFNSLLIEGKETRADPKSMYWESKNNAIWFLPSIDDAVEKLRYAAVNYKTMNANIEKQRNDAYEKYSWINITKQYMYLCK